MICPLMAAFFLLLFLPGCGGFRGGTASIPYVGERHADVPEPKTFYELRKLEQITLPEMVLKVSLNNVRQDYNTEVIGYVIPTKLNLKDKAYHEPDEKFQIRLEVTPQINDLTFDPARINLDVDGIRHVPNNPSIRKRPVNSLMPLPIGKWHIFVLVFDMAPPTPEQAISLDLSQAFGGMITEEPLVIKFIKVRWSKGYSSIDSSESSSA